MRSSASVRCKPADDLAEREVGPWTGLTFEEIDLTWPGALQRREWPEGFEDDDAIVERAVAAVTHLAATIQRAVLA